ncbi:dimethyl sulfoxide reductase anchor subunit family protein [Mesorhizobium amorphae]|uniref:dimethyl sulfoxide reductase anchor subunit family protein n=1 Tax=Mesorhizobium amorphae TaxID=71433 RepID=UPI0021B34457|nr:DmsC/YnfH family molybdoenzyme membrane anchor subunit [Mesorhizobium amorphae]
MLGLGLLDPAAIATKAAHILALGLIAGGLLSSTLHLGNPQRAWRAFSQWRSSWLSREGVLSVLAFVPLTVSAWLCVIEGRYFAPIGLAGSVLSLVTVFCTSMIYASMKSVQAWHTRLTTACYLLFAMAGGALLGSASASREVDQRACCCCWRWFCWLRPGRRRLPGCAISTAFNPYRPRKAQQASALSVAFGCSSGRMSPRIT